MKLINKKARRDYQILEEIEGGLLLNGGEVKSLRVGKGNLNEAFVRIKNQEAWIHNFLIPAYQPTREEYDAGRARKLLLHKKELLSLEKKMEGKNLALVPLRVYLKRGLFKVTVGLGKGKKQHEKRREIKKRDLQRELRRSFKEEQIR